MNPDFIQLILLQNRNTRRDLLRFKPRIHLINGFFRNSLEWLTLQISLLANIDWKVGHVNAIDTVFICSCKRLILVHLRSL